MNPNDLLRRIERIERFIVEGAQVAKPVLDGPVAKLIPAGVRDFVSKLVDLAAEFGPLAENVTEQVDTALANKAQAGQ